MEEKKTKCRRDSAEDRLSLSSATANFWLCLFLYLIFCFSSFIHAVSSPYLVFLHTFLSVSLFLSPSPSVFNSRLLNVGHSVWKLPSPFSLSLPCQSFSPSFPASSSPPLGMQFVWAGSRLPDSLLAWLDTAVLDMIYIAYGECRSCTIIRPGHIYILELAETFPVLFP